MNINPEDEDLLFSRAPKRVQELAKRARAQRRSEARAQFAADLRSERGSQRGRGW